MSDTTLFQALAHGEPAAFDEVCRRYGERVAKMAHRQLGRELRRRLETADIVQTAFLAIVRDAGKACFDSEGAFLRWMHIVIERKILNAARRWRAARRHLRREVPLREEAQQVCDFPVESPSQIVARKETGEKLALAIADLPAADREVLISRVLLELPWAAVSKALGTTEEAAQMRFVRARRRLQAALELAML